LWDEPIKPGSECDDESKGPKQYHVCNTTLNRERGREGKAKMLEDAANARRNEQWVRRGLCEMLIDKRFLVLRHLTYSQMSYSSTELISELFQFCAE
jgi:hypothetical protein